MPITSQQHLRLRATRGGLFRLGALGMNAVLALSGASCSEKSFEASSAASARESGETSPVQNAMFSLPCRGEERGRRRYVCDRDRTRRVSRSGVLYELSHARTRRAIGVGLEAPPASQSPVPWPATRSSTRGGRSAGWSSGPWRNAGGRSAGRDAREPEFARLPDWLPRTNGDAGGACARRRWE